MEDKAEVENSFPLMGYLKLPQHPVSGQQRETSFKRDTVILLLCYNKGWIDRVNKGLLLKKHIGVLVNILQYYRHAVSSVGPVLDMY